MNAVAAAPAPFLSIDEYLAVEAQNDVKHEFIGGILYAMAGASKRHNAIATEIQAQLSAHFGNGKCQAYLSDVKISLMVFDRQGVYYPDVVVTCDPREDDEYFVQYPKLIVEVLSESTESVDRREKFWSYIQLDSLEEYILVAQDRVEVTIFRRSNGSTREVFTSISDEVAFRSIDLTLKVQQIYRRVTF